MFDLQEEYASLAQHLDIDWDALAGRHVLVTGATGLIGSLCARTLLERNRLTGAGIIVDALVRDPAKAQAMLGQYTADDGLVLHRSKMSTRSTCRRTMSSTPPVRPHRRSSCPIRSRRSPRS